MSCHADISTQRDALRSVDRALIALEIDLVSTEAAALVGRARAMIRAADQVLGTAAREERPATPAQMPAAIAAAQLAAVVSE